MPSCSICEQFLYLIKTQRPEAAAPPPPRQACVRVPYRPGRGNPEAGPGVPQYGTMGLPNWVTQATESKTTAIVADRHLGVTRESGVTCATPARSVGPP